jgi:hypothetical protein
MTDFSFYALYPKTKAEIEKEEKALPEGVKANPNNEIKLLDKVGFENLPRENFKAIRVKVGKGDILTQHFSEDQLPIFRSRNFTTPGGNKSTSKEPIVYLLGWRMKVGGKVIQSIIYICDWVGRGFNIHVAGKFDDNHSWFYGPNFFENEVFEGERYYDPQNKVWKVK